MNAHFQLCSPSKLELLCSIPFLTSAWRRAGYNQLTQSFYNRQSRELQAMKTMFRHVWGKREPLLQAVGVGIIYIVPMPKSWSLKKKKELDGTRCCVKPDYDNLSKFLLDAMTGIVYRDDCQCYASGRGAAKFWGQEGRTYIWIETDEQRLTIDEIEQKIPLALRRTLGDSAHLQIQNIEDDL